MTSQQLELTMAIIKPHAVKVPFILKGIREMILSNRFFVVRSKRMTMSEEIAGKFYVEHENKFFYTRLLTSMRSGPSDMYILARENAIANWREIMGPTKVFQTMYSHPETIRGKYGLTDTRNSVHGSDSVTSTEKETQLLFPEFNINEWYQNEEHHFRNNDVDFNGGKFVHQIKKLPNNPSVKL